MASQVKLKHNCIIEGIVPRKRSKNKFDLLLSHHEKISVSINTILKFKIQKGDKLSRSTIDSLIDFEMSQTIKDRILIYLSYKPRSKSEILNHFKNKGFPDDLILYNIDKLEKKGYVDDVVFAKMYIKNLVEKKMLGENSVRSKLYKHSIKSDILDHIIEKVYKKHPPISLIRKIIKKKSFVVSDEIMDNKKIIYHLKRKGFHWEDIASALSQSEI